jgi:hypothetical protein
MGGVMSGEISDLRFQIEDESAICNSLTPLSRNGRDGQATVFVRGMRFAPSTHPAKKALRM